jgi:starvation-inducible DNA-binding protein
MALPIDIGINEKQRSAIADGLSRLLADTYTLYLTTHNFHWNVTGRSLGHPAPGSYAQFKALSSIDDVPATPPKALEMVRILVQGHEAVARTARQVFPTADDANDQPTADLLTQRMDIHEKTAWMLRSLLEE